MGWVTMSERELNRVEILGQVVEEQLSVERAADLLDLSKRQVFRLLSRFRVDGPSGLRHRARGRPPNNRITPAKRQYVLDLIRESFADFGPTLASEALEEYHGIAVSRETLRRWMSEDGLWLPRKQSRSFHQPRLRRECYGELIQIDGSDHHWFEDRAPRCTLLVFIDDATSTLMQLRFVASESTFSYFEALELYLRQHGRPVAFYSDKHSVFRVANQSAKSGHGVIQFGRSLNELNLEILCANSSQAKGGVERANRTLQDRLVKELRLAGICDMTAANAFLVDFVEQFNFKFAKQPRRLDNLHRALNIEPDRLRDILCLRDERYVGRQLSFSYNRNRVILEENGITRGLQGKYIDSYEFFNGQLVFKHKVISLPYKLFDKDQRVTHAAITENKRLSAVLEYVKAEQDKEPPKKRRAGKQRTNYQPSGRKNDGWNSLGNRRRAADQGCDV